MKTREQQQRAIDDQLADRRDARNTLIERRNGLDTKIARVEEQIRALNEKRKNV
jgi:hypothetical protein